MDALAFVSHLAQDLVRIDSRSAVSNLPIADRLELDLHDFELERLEYKDDAGVNKCALVAARGKGGLALSGHMDTVPDTGWTTDPWSGAIEGDCLFGLGSTDMKGPVAAIVAAASALPASVPVALLITADEETTKQGARLIARSSELARSFAPRGIVIAEPTGMVPVRGHRSSIEFTAVATGVQAHSSTGEGHNANWTLIPFMVEMQRLFERLRNDPALQDVAYDPPFSDFNPVIDNHGAAPNITVPKASVRIKYRYSAGVDPAPVVVAVHEAAAKYGLEVSERPEGPPPELPVDHPLVALAASMSGAAPRTVPFGTDASELQVLAPCLIFGPGDVNDAHKPTEKISLSTLAEAVPVFARMVSAVAG
ncbi:MAG TPA: M20/M25/M40 family metallo-hydrolase [Acetobacteraceae bacterium]|nr:M20/M25/M40 family metallo-hydrolase [Acetobacteraceae bacterium]